MRIALVGAEFEENLSVRYIWSALEHAGHEVTQIIFNDASEINRAARELVESKAEIAGFSMVFTHRSREFAMLASAARTAGFTGHIVAGGPFAAFNAEALLRDVPAFSSVAIGNGESLMTRLAERQGNPLSIDGFVWRDEQGGIIRNPPAENRLDLDSIHWPVRKDPPDRFLDIPIANMLSSRGCTHGCRFCSIAAWHRLCGGSRHRFRSVESVADEMAALYAEGYRIFNFHDDNFLAPSICRSFDRIRALKRSLEHRGVDRVAFAIKARPDEVDRHLFACLSDMGLFRVFLGIEAGTARSLTSLGRGQTLHENENALNIVNDLGLHACFNLLLFNPDSTFEDFVENVCFLNAHPLNPMNFCRTEIYAGTPFERQLARQGRLAGNYWGYDYEIADPKAELSCGIMYRVFRDRCYGNDALHHLTMAVDYEERLLTHFYRHDARLHRQAKEFIKNVNLNTSGYLLEIASAVDRGFGSDAACADAAIELGNRIAADTQKLRSVGRLILGDIRTQSAASTFSRKTHFWAGRVAAVAGLTAAVVTANCDKAKKHEGGSGPGPQIEKFHTMVCEMIAPPPPGDSAEKVDAGAKANPPKAPRKKGGIDSPAVVPRTHVCEMAPPRPVRPPRTGTPAQVSCEPSLSELKKKYNSSDLLHIGRLALGEGIYNDAIMALEAIPEYPQSDKRTIYLVWAYVEAGRTKDALFMINSHTVNDAQFEYLCGRVYQMANKYGTALEYYRNSLTKPSIVRTRDEVRRDALYYSALSWSEICESDKTQDNLVQTLNAWRVVKRLYEQEPEHSRYKRAVKELNELK